MKWLGKILLWLLAVFGALVVAVIGTQVYFRLTPSALNDEAKALLAETAHMAQLTVNGYRLYGLKAPSGMDPAAYGKCKLEAASAFAKTAERVKMPSDNGSLMEYATRYSRGEGEATANCREGKPELLTDSTQDKNNTFRIQPLFDWNALKGQTDQTRNLPAEVVSRWETVLVSGRRGNLTDLALSHYAIGNQAVMMPIERARLAEFARAWDAAPDDAARTKASIAIDSAAQAIAKYGDGTLIESTLTMSALAQQLLVVQQAVSGRSQLDETLSSVMSRTTAAADRAPANLANAIGAEFQFSRAVSDQVARGDLGNLQGIETVGPTQAWLSAQPFDRNDVLNIMAPAFRDFQSVARAPKLRYEDTPTGKRGNVVGCAEHSSMWPFCMLYERNPVGRIMAMISLPMYADYTRRAHDLTNLAAATRLTIEARKRGLTGESLAAFVANAPLGMRDVYTSKPFAYDVAAQKLTVEVRTRSPVLGEKSYQLPL